jgi:CYTH domain-containing protein
MIESERKFLVMSDAFKNDAGSFVQITQGFLNTHPERSVRVRIMGELAFLTVKGISDKTGVSRFEWETEIGVGDARELMVLCEEFVIDKTRYFLAAGKHIFEVDEFHGSNQGLRIAEIELTTPDELFERPTWLGQEVTGDIRYYNAQLSRKPYKFWEQ